MAENVDLSLVLERLNEVLAGQREFRERMTAIETKLAGLYQNTATRSQFLAIADSFNQFDSLLASLDARVAVLETRLTH